MSYMVITFEGTNRNIGEFHVVGNEIIFQGKSPVHLIFSQTSLAKIFLNELKNNNMNLDDALSIHHVESFSYVCEFDGEDVIEYEIKKVR